jgi:hypothetical protein
MYIHEYNKMCVNFHYSSNHGCAVSLYPGSHVAELHEVTPIKLSGTLLESEANYHLELTVTEYC